MVCKYFNARHKKEIQIKLEYSINMPPSNSSRLLIENLNISNDDVVLDLGAGSGVVGIAALKLGARQVTFCDIQYYRQRSLDCLSANLYLNSIDSNFEISASNLFDSLSGQRFTKILTNPPSIPSDSEECLGNHQASGWNGRQIHDIVQGNARNYLVKGGCLVAVHSSLCNVTESIKVLAANGFECHLSRPMEVELREFHDVEYIKKLANQGLAIFSRQDDRLFKYRLVLNARVSRCL